MPVEQLEMTLGDVRARVAPARGALVTSLEVKGRELLYLDEETLEDPAKSVRGGIPLLFPFAGSLDNHYAEAAGARIPQHGFGRNAEWRVLERTAGAIRLEMEIAPKVLAIWPWAMRVEHHFLLTDSGMHLELMVWNRGTRPMPLSPGWHPYFRCEPHQKQFVTGDFLGTEPGNLHDLDEVNYGLVPPADACAEFLIPGLGNLRLRFAPRMRHLQIWSIPGRPFVCLEPFWGAPNTLNTPAALVVPAGEARSIWFRVRLLENGIGRPGGEPIPPPSPTASS